MDKCMSRHHRRQNANARLSILYSIPVFSAMFVWLCLRNVSLSFVSFLVRLLVLTHSRHGHFGKSLSIDRFDWNSIPSGEMFADNIHSQTDSSPVVSFFHFVCWKEKFHLTRLVFFFFKLYWIQTSSDAMRFDLRLDALRLDLLRNFVRHSFICQPVNIWRWRGEGIIYILCYVYHLHSPFIFYKIIFA